MNGITEFIKVLGPTRLAAMGAVAIGLVGFFAFVMLQMTKPKMVSLFSNLTMRDSIAIVKKLEGMNIPHEVRHDGSIILVPKDQVLRLRMRMAEDGLPIGGGRGNEIFDNPQGLGTTSTIQNINQKRAIEGELARTIRAIERVEAARVHLVLPKKKLFSPKSVEPSASIWVRVLGTLETSQVRAIQNLTAAAIEGLKPSSVSIVDQHGRLLASGNSGAEDGVVSGAAEERNRQHEIRMKNEIEKMVASIVGAGRVRVKVTSELDYNRRTESSEIYDPEGQVIRSTKTLSKASSAQQPVGDNGVTVGNELPSAGANNNNAKTQKEQLQTSEEVVNYDISKTQKTEVTEAGRIKRISVAVLVDGIYTKNSKGVMNYAPRPVGELEDIAKLVKTAVGFDVSRGDQVHVSNIRFADSGFDNIQEEEGGWGLTMADYMSIAEVAVSLLVGFMVVMMVVRPLIRRIITPEETVEILEQEVIEEQLAEIERRKAELLKEVEGDVILDQDGNPVAIEPNSDAVELLKSAKLNGEIQASFIKEVGTLVINNPQEATTIIRTWIEKGDDRDDEVKAQDAA